MQTVALEGVTDQSLFDEANADEAPETVVEPAEEVIEPEEQPRDELGQYAAKPADEPVTAAVTDPPAPAPVDDNAAMVPSWRVREINEERRQVAAENERLKAEMALWQRPQPAPQAVVPPVEKAARPDPLLDPDGYATAIRQELREELREEALNDRRETSLANAHKTYKTDFEEAYAAAQKQIDPALKARMQASRDPGETLMEWHREQKTRAEVGNDPNAFFQKRLDAWLADPANQAAVIERARGGAQQQLQPVNGNRPAPATSLPPSLTRIASAASTSADDDDVSDEGLWKHANA